MKLSQREAFVNIITETVSLNARVAVERPKRNVKRHAHPTTGVLDICMPILPITRIASFCLDFLGLILVLMVTQKKKIVTMNTQIHRTAG